MSDADNTTDSNTLEGHGGDLALAALRSYGVQEMFTLSGGHVFPMYDAAHTTGMPIIDVRHEQTAVFAAEGIAKLAGRPGLAVLTAGPGITNGISALTTAYFNGSPIMVVGGRAPQFRWGSGGLQELDHVPIVKSITKWAGTSTSVEAIPADISTALSTALTAHRGPAFLDIPMDVIFSRATAQIPVAAPIEAADADPEEVRKASELIATAARPVIIAGSDVYAGKAWEELTALAETFSIPTITNGQGRGCLPADHRLSVRRARKAAMQGADLVIVIGTPLDFRLGFGDFGAARVVHIVDSPAQKAGHVTVAAAPAGDLKKLLTAIVNHEGPRADRTDWCAHLADAELAGKSKETVATSADGDPIKPSRVYGELQKVLERDAVVIGDGGDFVSYAGKYLDSYQPGCWLDPGPYGCLGTGPGYAIAARIARPSSQVCLMLGDGAAGFSLMDVETMVRHKLPIVMVVGNNGIWGLEKAPMQMMYGYDVAADLQPGLRYDDVVGALGGAGETVTKSADLSAAFARGFQANAPYLINVLTDPADVYPRSSVLA